MSDISININLVALVLIFGWPGLLLGSAIGAILWRRRRLLGGVLGAVSGCLLWSAAALLVKLN